MTEPTKEQDSIFQKIEWASNTHKDKLMFGLDELGASIAREHRLHGVLMSAKNELTRKDQEIKTLKEQLESANAVIYHVVYSTEDSQGLAYGYLEENSLLKQNKEINNEK